jgi:hypothetical protein
MPAKTTDLRRELKRTVDKLSEDRLKTAVDFLGYLQSLESDDATMELMRIPGALEAFRQGKREVETGRTVPVGKLRRKY